MKSKDWSLVGMIILVSAILSFVISNFTIGTRKTNKLKVESVSPLTDNFALPNEKYFNGSSINPTQEIKIGEATNENPFKSNQ